MNGPSCSVCNVHVQHCSQLEKGLTLCKLTLSFAGESSVGCDNCDIVLLLHFQDPAALTLSATKVAHTRSLCPCEFCLDDRHLWPLSSLVVLFTISRPNQQYLTNAIIGQGKHPPLVPTLGICHVNCQLMRQNSSNPEIDLFRYYGRLLAEAT